MNKMTNVIDKILALQLRNMELKTGARSMSIFQADIKPNSTQLSQFSEDQSDDFTLPLKVSGTLITAATYPDQKYGQCIISPSELKKSTEKWVGIEFYKSHGIYRKILLNDPDVPIDAVFGKITKAKWVSSKNQIEYEGLVYNRQIAYNILMGLTNKISVGFENYIKLVDGNYYKTDIMPREVSMVYNPRDKNATIKASTE